MTIGTAAGRFADRPAEASGTFTIEAGGGKLTAASPKTGSYTTFQKVTLGTLEISKAGVTTLAVHPVPTGWQPMNLKSIRLDPVK